MTLLSLYSTIDVQEMLAAAIRQKRKDLKLSRQALATSSTVPASTIKKFENTGQISLRQFLLLWQCVDDLSAISALLEKPKLHPRTIAEVLKS